MAPAGDPKYVVADTFLTSTTPLALTATDGGTRPVGVAATDYRIDGGPWTSNATPFFVGSEGRHAVTYRKVLRTAVVTGLVVGTILTAINQGNLILNGHFPPILFWKIPLTYSVPYCVSTFSALRVSFTRSP